jgi:hypothetical protein
MENAEIRRCGQAFLFGRYCTHSHQAGNMEGSYVKANSIHHSYQRAVTTHDTQNWEVRDNVAFNIGGHAYFVEDGTEHNNYLTGNLGVFILRSSALLMSDMKPAVFWSSTPTNYWRDNVAVHSAMFGFWFEPVGSIDTFCPINDYIGECVNITVHSNSDIGLRIYPMYTPLTDPCGGSNIPSAQYIYNLLSFNNGGNGLFSKEHGDIHHVSPTLVGNGGHEISIVHYEHVYYTKNPVILNALLVGILDEHYVENMDLGKYGIWTPQDEYFYIKNVTFKNYGRSGAITGCNECEEGSSLKQGAFTTRFEGLKFPNTQKRLVWSPTYKEILWDLDGSLAGVPDSMITMYYDVINWPDVCTVLHPVSVFSNSLRCGGNGTNARIRRVQLDAVTPSQLSYTDVVVRSAVGESEYNFLPMDTYGWVFAAVTGTNKTYTYEWKDAGVAARTLNLTLGRVPYLLETINKTNKYNEDVHITYSPYMYDYIPYSFATTYNGISRYIPNNYTRSLKKMADSSFHNITVDLLLTNKGALLNQPAPFAVYAVAKLCPPKGCPIPPVPTLSNPMLWSKKASWPTKKIPVAGQKVIIEANMWIVLDTSPPKLGCIVVYGRLSFQSNASHPLNLNLMAQCIQVYGELKIVGENDTAPFIGDASVTLYGAKGSSLPVTMTEGVFLGSKVIGVAGNLTVVGQPKKHSWVKLRHTALANTSMLVLSQYVGPDENDTTGAEWRIGDEVAISPTSYFTSQGVPWYYNTNVGKASDEIRLIKAIDHHYDASTGRWQYSTITLNSSLSHTHLCEQSRDGRFSFCGAVGILTRNIRFLSQDSENIKTTSYGFGGNIHAFDIPAAKLYAKVKLINTEFKYFGKVNSDHYAISLSYTSLPSHASHPPAMIANCSFNSGYNFAIRTVNVPDLTFTDNVASRNYGGGVLIDETSINYKIEGNLIIGTRQLPSILLSSHPWVRPVAGITISNRYGTVKNNLVAGSEDQGFTIATSVFHVPSSLRSLCSTTSSGPYSYTEGINEIAGDYLRFSGNEAVAGKGGLFIMAMGLSESRNDDCSVIKGFVSWRNAHTGIMTIDSVPNLLIANSLLAENYIGFHGHFIKTNIWGFSGIVNSTVISSLASVVAKEDVSVNTMCYDLGDSLYLPGRQCHAFSATDPISTSLTCQSILSSMYRRVGLLIPMFTNKARTCAMSGAFTPCDPPNTPDRLCQMPWEKRYALPIPGIYTEFHIHDLEFIGFNSSSFKTSTESPAATSSTSHCIPSLLKDRTAAIALNPTEYDTQPTVITSGLKWTTSGVNSRISFDQGPWKSDCLAGYPCEGQMMVIVHDHDGSMIKDSSEDVDDDSPISSAGQLLYNNPAYLAPFPYCYAVSDLYLSLYYCPSTLPADGNANDDFNNATMNGFQQYSGLWDDTGPQIIQPIITSRSFEDRNVSFPSFGPQNDMCAKRFYYSQFNFLWADHSINYVRATGTPPPSWTIRWDAPSEDNVAILDFFIEQSLVINVYVSDNGKDNYINVPKQLTYPTFNDPAGTNQRDPQKRKLSVTIRGGKYRFYQFVIMPVAAVTIKMDMPIASFYADTFIANLALLLNIASSRIKITSVRAGSVIADFEVSPSNTLANSSLAVRGQIDDLNGVTANLTHAISTGYIETALNVTVEQVFTVPPVVPVELNPILDLPANSTYNDTEARSVLIQANTAQIMVLFTYPTSFPTNQPSSQPSTRPTRQPSSRPTCIPSSQPSSHPTRPTSHPSGQPSRQPSSHPSAQPSRKPSSHPTSLPSRHPTAQPISLPSGHPSSQPTKQPISRPTTQPSRHPTSQPSRIPSSKPSDNPSSEPTSSPFSFPTSRPTVVPSDRPSGKPSTKPSGSPSSIPSRAPSGKPSAFPSGEPSTLPSVLPSSEPSTIPSSFPTGRPSGVPSSLPTSIPTSSRPTSVPSGGPSRSPSGVPSCRPSAIPSNAPSSVPSCSPSSAPTDTPSVIPSTKPSKHPSSKPSGGPSDKPSGSPSVRPTDAPSGVPSTGPSETPSTLPSAVPSSEPSTYPSVAPTAKPSAKPSSAPSAVPTGDPTSIPSYLPTAAPTTFPSSVPSSSPTIVPTSFPSAFPTTEPSSIPTLLPTSSPSGKPSSVPVSTPSTIPTCRPSSKPTSVPTSHPTSVPTAHPTAKPTSKPNAVPSAIPTTAPHGDPTSVPSGSPSSQPSAVPLPRPTSLPSGAPLSFPSSKPSPHPSTAKPSTAIPTASPTTGQITLVHIACGQTLNGCTASDFDSSAKKSFEETISSIASHGGSTATANITSVSDANRRRQLLASKEEKETKEDSAKLNTELRSLSAGSVHVEYTVTYSLTNQALTVSTPSEVYQVFVSSMKSAVINGTLISALQSSGLSAFATITTTLADLNISSYSVEILTFGSPTVQPTTAADKAKESIWSGNFITGITIGGFFVCLFLGFCVLARRRQGGMLKHRKGREAKVIPLTIEGFTNIADIERHTTPDVKAVHQFRFENLHRDPHHQYQPSGDYNSGSSPEKESRSGIKSPYEDITEEGKGENNPSSSDFSDKSEREKPQSTSQKFSLGLGQPRSNKVLPSSFAIDEALNEIGREDENGAISDKEVKQKKGYASP